jgi:hypothetical protein
MSMVHDNRNEVHRVFKNFGAVLVLALVDAILNVNMRSICHWLLSQ